MSHIGYFNKEGERLDVFTTPTVKTGSWWFKREIGWVDSPRFVMVRNKYGWTYLVESNTEGLEIFEEYQLIIDKYWRGDKYE